MDEQTTTSTEEVVFAQTVYLLMTKEHRISKHLRAKWYLEHVNTVMQFPDPEEKVGHPKLVSVLIKDGETIRTLQPGSDGKPVKFKLTTFTTVNFLSTHHDIVFAVDVSFSTISSSTAEAEVLFDSMYEALRKAITGLTKTFIIPGSNGMVFTPYIYVTVIAYCPINNCPVQQVLTHGYLVTHHNVKEFIEYISDELNKFENGVAAYMNAILKDGGNTRHESGSTTSAATFSSSVMASLKGHHLSPETGFFYLLKNAMLAIQLLPTNCSSGIIVITDGNVGIGDVGRYDNLLIQLLSQSCTCSVIEVPCSKNHMRGLGRVSHSEMLQFIATATFGAYFYGTVDTETDQSMQMNEYHEGILCWDFRKSIQDSMYTESPQTSMTYEEKRRKRHDGYQLSVPLNCVITTRLKEGFTIKTVDAPKDNHIEVTMVLPWRKGISIEYKCSSAWPPPSKQHATTVEIHYEGNYHFLHDLLCKKSQPNKKVATKYRYELSTRFLNSMISLKTTDQCLVAIQSFHVEDEFYMIPDSVKKGQHLFNFNMSENPSEIKHHREGADIKTFAEYWKIVLSLDLGVMLDKIGVIFDRSSHIMEKWFHITRLYMVLEHDPRNIESLGSVERYHNLQCRHASQALKTKLREFADFELLEGSHYIKYIKSRPDDKNPLSGYYADNWQSFCMIMMNLKGACVCLRLTFLGGTDSIHRASFIEELREQLKSLKFQKRPEKSYTSSGRGTKRKTDGTLQASKSPHLGDLHEKSCCVLMSKPLDRVIIRYHRVPCNLLTVDNINTDIAPHPTTPSRLGNYLYHQRWVWSLHPEDDHNIHFDSLDMRTADNILNILTKLRLQEGYHFAQTNSDIVSMILEVEMTNFLDGTVSKDDQESLSCLVQYILFSPQKLRTHNSPSANSSSESDPEDDLPETHSVLSLVTEVWIEPQHGYATNNPAERAAYDGCTFSTWPEKLLQIDQKCVTLMTTMEHLLKYCTDNTVSRNSTSSSLQSGKLHDDKTLRIGEDGETEDIERVKRIPFEFSVIDLFPMCQQTEILLSTYSLMESETVSDSSHPYSDSYLANDILFEQIYSHIEHNPKSQPRSYEIELTQDECAKLMTQVIERTREPSTTNVPFKWQPMSEHRDDVVHTATDNESKTYEYLSSHYPVLDVGSPAVHNPSFSSYQDTPGFANSMPDASDIKPNEDAFINESTIPQWRCFCFSSDDQPSDQITVLLLPASYADLMAIGVTEIDQVNNADIFEMIPEEREHSISDSIEIPPLELNQSTPSTTRTDQSDSQKKQENAALILPVYIYQCSRSAIVEELINGSYARKSDAYVDLRFEKVPVSAREHRNSEHSDDAEYVTRRRFRTESTCSKRSIRSMSTDQSSESNDGFTAFCNYIFHRSFVTGIFQSLQKNYPISVDDVDSAISVCEEEVDSINITEFLKHICTHMTYCAGGDSSIDHVFSESVPSTPKNVTFAKEIQTTESVEADIESSPAKLKRTSLSSDNGMKTSNLRSPLTVKVQVSDLFGRPCDTIVDGARIKQKLVDVLGKWFTPIPTCKDVFFYAPPDIRSKTMQWVSDNPDKFFGPGWDTTASDTDDTAGNDSEDGNFFHAYSDDETTPNKRKSMHSNSTGDVVNVPPLFLHLTASIQTGRNSNNLSVRDIPVCLDELKDCFANQEVIDLKNLEVTLDLICDTLPPSWLDWSSDPTSAMPTDTDDIRTGLVSTEPVGLSDSQKSDILECKKNLEWLVRDEIASAMRNTGPVSEKTLKMVAEHVKNSEQKETCKYHREPLHYVFGPKESHGMFIEEFNRMNVTGYQLLKEGDYYFVSVDRAKLHNNQVLDHEEVANKLNQLNSKMGRRSTSDPQENSGFYEKSIEVLPHNTDSSGARDSSLTRDRSRCDSIHSIPAPLPPSSLEHHADWEPALELIQSNSHTKSSTHSESSDSVAVIDDDVAVASQIPIQSIKSNAMSNGFPRASSDANGIHYDVQEVEETLNSLPKHNPLDNWNREGESFEGKVGSLREAYSSSNVNMETESECRSLTRVNSFPHVLTGNGNTQSSFRTRHVSEDTGMRKRVTIVDDAKSPDSHPFPLTSTREFDEGGESRSRNTSGGPWTPGSNRFNGSTGSASDSEDSSYPGYEADDSDDDGTGGAYSTSEVGMRDPEMPSFWLIMQICAGSSDTDETVDINKSNNTGIIMNSSQYGVDVFYHRSETMKNERNFSGSLRGIIPSHELFSHVIGEIKRTCKLVNQRLLLKDLFNKRRCDVLLKEDSDEYPLGAVESSSNRRLSNLDLDAEPKSDDEDEYLAARMKFKPGHFQCECKWSKTFPLHPRLNTGKAGGVTRGFNALKSALSNFLISNRTNMFVHKQSHTDNIFYIQLSESPGGYCGPHDDAPSTGVSRTSSIRSLNKDIHRFKDDSDNRHSTDDHDMDERQSVTSRRSNRRHAEEGVKFCVFGIDEVGSDIKVDMVKMLESRLDETVLVEIENLLSRNPNCMLNSQDVQFIQRQEHPNKILKLTLPDATLHHQRAILHYLRQNLLQPELFFHPKYQDQGARFMDYTTSIDNAQPMADMNTYLHIKSPGYQNAGKGAGLALLYLQLVDSADLPKTLLECPRPDLEAWRSFTLEQFTRLTEVNAIKPDTEIEPMSTSSFIKVSIWSKGGIDLEALENQLHTSVRHSLCDWACEYYALTAPLCEVPYDVLSKEVMEEQNSSLSKGNSSSTPSKASNRHSILGRTKSAIPSANTNNGMAFTFHDEVASSSTSTSKLRLVTSPTLSLNEESMSDMFPRRHPAGHLVHSSNSEIEKYRFGEKGHLLPYYSTTLIDWFEYCVELNLPSVTKTSCSILNDCIIDPIMKEFEQTVKELSGVSTQAFRLVDNVYVPYQTSIAPLSQENGENTLNDSPTNHHLNFPYTDLSPGHMLTVRNKKLWLQSVGNQLYEENAEVSTPQPGSTPNRVGSAKSNQKFPPVYATLDRSLGLTSAQSSYPIAERQLLPRQQFVMLIIKEGQMVLYTYNLADGKDEPLQKHIKLSAQRLTKWNNARFHLLNCIAHQKMGLFHHVNISKLPNEDQEKENFTKSYEDVNLLIKMAHPPPDNKIQPGRQLGGGRTVKPPQQSTILDRVYYKSKPTRPMHLSKSCTEKDPILRHGSQLIETHMNELRDQERRRKLEKLYNGWQQRVGNVITEIAEEELDLLKQSSRLVHHVATPLLLSPHWRQRSMRLPRTYEEVKQAEDTKSSDGRSRNNSGASNRSGTRFIVEHVKPASYQEEAWHEEIRTNFVQNYIDYLRQTQQPLEQLGFTTIKCKPGKRGLFQHHRKQSAGGGAEQMVKTNTTESLQKTMNGGIFLIELSFQEVYFVVKLYVFSASQLALFKEAADINKKPEVTFFIESCDRMRDNTHCHSFAHDFHLRTVHKFIKATKDLTCKYHMVKMLKDFTRYYDDPPLYSRNAIIYKTVDLEATNNPCDKLYNHILNNELCKMKKITMTDDTPTDELRDREYDFALAYNLSLTDSSIRTQYGEYEASIVINHDHPNASTNPLIGKLDLSYFVILVNKEQFPVRVPHSIKSASLGDKTLETSTDRLLVEKPTNEMAYSSKATSKYSIQQYSTRWRLGPCTMMSHSLSHRREMIAFLKDSQRSRSGGEKISLHPAYPLLLEQSKSVRDRLTELVEEASQQFRRNSLWDQMKGLRDRNRLRHYTSDITPYQTESTKLAFDDFEELLSQVSSTPVHLHGGLHTVLHAMPIQWFINFTKVLATKYGNDYYREYTRSDSMVTHSVVLLPNVEEIVILLSINKENSQAKLELLRQDEMSIMDIDKTSDLNNYLDDFSSALCFHMWADMCS